MNDKNWIMFITANVLPDSAQGIRYINICQQLSKSYGITTVNPWSTKYENRRTGTRNRNRNGMRRFIKWLYSHLIEGFIFPDKFKYRLCKYNVLVENTIRSRSYSYAIIGMTPFSLYKIIPLIKNADKKIKIICDLSDPFIDNAAIKYWISGWRKKVIKFEREYLKSVEALVVPTNSIRRLYEEKYSDILRGKIFTIEQGVSIELLEIINSPKSASANNDQNILVYAGAFYSRLREPFELYKAIENIDSRDIILNIYGYIAPSFLPSKSTKIFFQGSISQKALFNEYMNSKIIIIIDNAFGHQVPGKIFEVIGFNKSILFIYSNPNSPTLDFLHNAGNVYKVLNQASLIQKEILHLLDLDPENIKPTDISAYTWDKIGDKYLNLLDTI